MSNVLKMDHVSKSFKKYTVLNDVNLEVQGRNIIGVVGPNGSGKTVLLKLLAGLSWPDAGEIRYNGMILKKDFDYLPSMGVLIEYPSFFDELTGFENLQLLASIRKVVKDEQIREWMMVMKLPVDSKKAGEYSLGMIQRLGLIQAFMEDPEVLLLDELTNSLDDEGIQMVHALLKKEREKGKIIIITSHSRYDIENLCDQVYRLEGGKLHHEK